MLKVHESVVRSATLKDILKFGIKVLDQWLVDHAEELPVPMDTITLAASDGTGAPVSNIDIDASGNNFIYTACRLVFTVNYVTGGDTLDLTPFSGLVPSGALPIAAFAEGNGPSTSQQGGGGYYAFLLGAALNNGKLKIFSSGGSELAAGAYPAAVTTDVVTLQVLWRKLRNY